MNKIIALILLAYCVAGRAQMQTDTFVFSFDGKRYSGLVDVPTGKAPAGLIVIIPGSGKTNMTGNRYYSTLRNHFVNDGYACCVWDKAGCGNSEGAYTDGQSIQNSADEAISAIEDLKRRNTPGADKIGLWGLSRGGWVCPLVITQYPGIAFWISVSGPDDKENTPYLLETNFRIEGRGEAQTALLVSEWKNGTDIFRNGGTFEAYQKATENLRADSFWLTISGQQYTKDGFERTQKEVVSEPYPYDKETGLRIYVTGFDTVLSEITCPVLAIFGEKDSQVDWKKSTALYKNTLGKSPDNRLTIKTFPNANHNMFECKTGGFMEKHEKIKFCEGYFETMTGWLKEVANKPATLLR